MTEKPEQQIGTDHEDPSEVIIKMRKSEAKRLLHAIEKALSIISES